MTFVDSHHHLWDPSRREYPWMEGLDAIRKPYTVDDLRAAAGPDLAASVLVQTVSSLEESEEFLAAADDSDVIAAVIGWVDLTDAERGIDRLRAARGGHLLAGIRHQVEDEPDHSWLLREPVLAGVRAVGAAGLVYDLLVKPPQLPAAIEAVRACPEVSFVLDHAAKPPIAAGEWEPWASGIRELAALPNVVCKLSGLVTEAEPGARAAQLWSYAEHALTCFGAERTMFGSDWPVCELAASYADVRSIAEELARDLSPTEQTALFSGTATRIYQLTHTV